MEMKLHLRKGDASLHIR